MFAYIKNLHAKCIKMQKQSADIAYEARCWVLHFFTRVFSFILICNELKCSFAVYSIISTRLHQSTLPRNQKSRHCSVYRSNSYPYLGGSEHILFMGGVILHTQTNFLTTDDRELKFYMVIDIYKLFQKQKKLSNESDSYAFMTSKLYKFYQILGQIRFD